MFRQLYKYLYYVLNAKTKHGIHSPFVFELITKVINDKSTFPVYKQIENLRNELLKNETQIEVIDLGAGSKSLNTSKRTISSIAKKSLKRKKYGQLLFRIVNHFKPETILELGTSLGITTLYLATANPTAKIITIEGSEAIAKQAQLLFKKSETKNITSVVSNFDDVLESCIKKLSSSFLVPRPLSPVPRPLPPVPSPLSLVYFDGNHRKQPTLNYFNQCLNYIDNNSIFIFDDIHWSDEMEQAWYEIKRHPRVTVTLDLFEIGIVFFKKELSKENFTILF